MERANDISGIEKKGFGCVNSNMIAGAADIFMIRAYEWSYEITAAIDVGVCLSRSTVRKAIMETGVMGKGVNWTGCIG